MSGPLEYASTHYPEMLDIPSDHPPASEEDIQMFKEISRELAELPARDIAEKAGERFEDEGKEKDEYEEKEVTCQDH